MQRLALKFFWFLLFVGFFLRVYDLGNLSLWEDELTQVFTSQSSWDTFWQQLLTLHISPPLDYLLTRLALSCEPYLGVSLETLVRIPPCICSLALIVLLFKDLKKNFSLEHKIAFILVTFAVPSLWFAQEARMYALFFLLSVLSIRSFQRQSWGVWTLVNILMIWTHYFSLFVIFCQIVLIVCNFNASRSKKTFPYVGLQLLAFLLLSPLFLSQFGSVARDASFQYGHEANWKFPFLIFYQTFFSFGEHITWGILLVILSLLGIATARAEGRSDIPTYVFLPLLLTWVLSPVMKITTTRNMFFLLYPLSLLLGYALKKALSYVSYKKFGEIAAIFVVLTLLICSTCYLKMNIRKEDFRSAAQLLALIAKEDPKAVFFIEGASWFGPVYGPRNAIKTEHIIPYYPNYWSGMPRRSILLDAAKAVRPKALLVRLIDPELERSLVQELGYEQQSPLSGLKLYTLPRKVPEKVTNCSEGLDDSVTALCQGEGNSVYLTGLMCYQKSQKSFTPPLLNIQGQGLEPQTWALNPFLKLLPTELLPDAPFAYLFAIKLRMLKTTPLATPINLTLDNKNHSLTVPDHLSPCD